jgi:hypothetical protein
MQHFDQASLSQELEGGGFRLDDLVGDLTGADPEPDLLELCTIAVVH